MNRRRSEPTAVGGAASERPRGRSGPIAPEPAVQPAALIAAVLVAATLVLPADPAFAVQPPPRAAAASAATAAATAAEPVFLDQLLSRATVQGDSTYSARVATIEGVSYPRSLVTEVGRGGEGERTVALSLRLDGRYERFTVTVGRDDLDATRGAGLAFFEVYADDKPLYRSAAPLRSPRAPVRIAPGVAVRNKPERLALDVRNVRTLRLVTRYAAEIPQEGPTSQRARGCVWGDARLTPLPGAVAGASPSPPGDPLRDSLRLLALQAASSAAAGGAAASSAPLRLLVAPPAAPRGAPGGARRATEIAALLRDQVLAVRRGGVSLFRAPDSRQETAFSRAARSASSQDAAARTAALEAAARSAGGDILLVTSLLPPVSGTAWRLEVRVVDLRAAARATAPPTFTADLPPDLQ